MHALTLTVKMIIQFVLCINFQINKVISYKWLDKSAKENKTKVVWNIRYFAICQSTWTEFSLLSKNSGHKNKIRSPVQILQCTDIHE